MSRSARGRAARLLLCGLALLGGSCLPSPSGGGSSEAEGLTLAGRLVDSAQRPLSGARVALFAEGGPSRPDAGAPALDSTRADNQGRYAFRGLRAGRYAILATEPQAGLAALRSRIELTGDRTLAAMAMGRSATLSGRLPAGFPYSRAARVVLLGTPYGSPVAADGGFRIEGMVAGTFTFAPVFRSEFGFADPAVLGGHDTLTVEAGGSLVLDSARLPSLAAAETLLVDAFGDCDRTNSLGGPWWSTDDRGAGGNSRVHAFDAVPEADGCAARFAFRFGRAAPYPFVGIGTYFLPEADSLPLAVSLEDAAGISFRVKGRGAALEVLLQSSVAGLVSGQGFDIAGLPAAWTTYTLDFRADMKDTYDSADARSWGQRRKAITHIQFDALPIAGTDSGEVWIDDLRILPR